MELPLEPAHGPDGSLLGFVIRPTIGEKGKPVRLLLDTGSSGLFLLQRLARKRGFEPLSEETFFGGGGSQRHVSPRGLFPTFAVGELRFADAEATTSTRNFAPQGKFRGVLGLSVFDGYRVTLDLPRKRLILDQEEPLTTGSSYWVISGQMLVRVRANDEGGGLFLLDTGATSSLLGAAFAERLPGVRFRKPAYLLGFGGRREGARYVEGVQLAFQELAPRTGLVPAVDLSLRSRMTGVEISGYLGLDLLAGARIVIDTRTRRIASFGSPKK
jgi:hypothetical protein